MWQRHVLGRCAQVIARCRSVADGSLDSTALPAAVTRVMETTRARSGLAGANTPWYLVSCAAAQRLGPPETLGDEPGTGQAIIEAVALNVETAHLRVEPLSPS